MEAIKAKDLRLLFLDTETTGVPIKYDAPFSDLKNWPNCVQIYGEMTDGEGNIIEFYQAIQKPVNFIIPQRATDIHGITQQMAIEKGISNYEMFDTIFQMISEADYIICHNYNFDANVIAAELYRTLGLDFGDFFMKKRFICTMEETTNLLKLPAKKAGSFKWPSLQELHKYCFGVGFDKAHDAEVDVKATVRCFFELMQRGIFRFDGFYFQKNF